MVEFSGSHKIRNTHTHTHTHTHTYTQLVGLLSTIDQLVTNYTTLNKHKRRTSIPLAVFETGIPEIERSQTYALDRMATGIGKEYINIGKFTA